MSVPLIYFVVVDFEEMKTLQKTTLMTSVMAMNGMRIEGVAALPWTRCDESWLVRSLVGSLPGVAACFLQQKLRE
jgi:hypothetical protein